MNTNNTNNTNYRKTFFKRALQSLQFWKWRKTKLAIGICAAVIAIAILIITIFSIAPSGFPDKEIVKIKKGMYLSQVADLLKSDSIIKSAFLFKLYAVLVSGKREIQAGDYLFTDPQSAITIATRMVYGAENLPKIKLTISEGLNSDDIAAILKKDIPDFDTATFVALAKPDEGYLFPDTYYIYDDANPDDIVSMLRSAFDDKIKTALLQVQAFGRPIDDVIKMASIVEREAPGDADRKIIAGILWKRLDANMPLQVDSSLYYLLGKPSSELTLKDLAIDSPYNLYKHTGLPPTPIANPGLDAIIDTITPTTTNYWYYLSDSNGNMHYAATLSEHAANKSKYIE